MIVLGSPMAVHAAKDVNSVSDAEKREMREQIKRELRAEGATADTWDLEKSGITYEKK